MLTFSQTVWVMCTRFYRPRAAQSRRTRGPRSPCTYTRFALFGKSERERERLLLGMLVLRKRSSFALKLRSLVRSAQRNIFIIFACFLLWHDAHMFPVQTAPVTQLISVNLTLAASSTLSFRSIRVANEPPSPVSFRHCRSRTSDSASPPRISAHSSLPFALFRSIHLTSGCFALRLAILRFRSNSLESDQ
jgi:hypothetical protein